MKDEDIDFSEIPQLSAEWFQRAVCVPGPKKLISLRLDPDVLQFFRKKGRRYQTAMNSALRQHMIAQQLKHRHSKEKKRAS